MKEKDWMTKGFVILRSLLVCMVLAALAISEAPAEVVEFEDSFEVSEWNGLWFEDAQNDWYRSTRRETDGSYSAEVDGRATDATLTMATSINLFGKGSATLTFSWFIEKNWDSGEYIALDVSDDDGANWYEIKALRGNVDTENVWHHETVDLSAYMVSNFKIQFRATVSSSKEDGNVDNVKIVSSGIPDATPPTITSITGDISTTTGETVDIVVTAEDNVDPTSAKIFIDGDTTGILMVEGPDDTFTYTYTAPIDSVAPHTYYVEVYDAAENSARAPGTGTYTITVTDNDAPAPITDLTATAVGGGSIELAWSAATDNIGVVSYNVYRASSAITDLTGLTPIATGVTATSYIDAATADGTTYYYAVTGVDSAGNEGAVSNSPGATADATVPAISDVTASNITGSSAIIIWTTNEVSNSVVRYGTATPPTIEASDATMVTSHSVTLTGLNAGTTYYYEVESTDAAGNTATDNNGGAYYTFTTTAPDTELPAIANATGNTLGTTGEPVTISATITDNVDVVSATVHYIPIDGTETTVPMTEGASDVWSTDVPVASDKIGTITYYISAQDVASNPARDPETGTYSISVTDNDAPVAEAGPDQSVFVNEEVTFDGSGSSDNIGITSYSWDFDANGGLQEDATGATATHTYTAVGIYTVTLSVSDDAGNTASDTLTVTVSDTPAEVVEFEDSFEVSEWNGLWGEDGQNDWFRSTQRETDGSRSAEVDGSATDATLTMIAPIDLSGKEDATLTFSWFIESRWDDGEYIACDVYDGSWHEIRVIRGNVDTENVWHHESVNLSAYMVSNFKIRFRAKVSSSREDGNVDDVKIVSGIIPDTDLVSYPFQGIKRTHRSAISRRPLNINVLEVDLNDPGVSIFVTPGNPDLDRTSCEEVIARKTTTFVSEFDLQVGINGDFSEPDCNFSRIEGKKTGVYGLGVSYREAIQGLPEIPRDQYSPHNNRPALTFTQPKNGYIGWYGAGTPFPDEVYNAVAGNKMLVEDGQPVDPDTWDPIGGALGLNPRTSVGLSSDGSKLIIIVIDGRQAGFSEGVMLPEMGEYLIEFGADTGLNLDGGGSSTMVFGTPSGPDIINYPSDGTERVRANHLGIYAAPVTSATPVLAQIHPKRNVPVSSLLQNYPNPFNPETWIPFTLSKDTHVVIRIYSINGQLIRTLDLGYKSAGIYVSRNKAGYWNGRNVAGEKVANSVYFYLMEAGKFRAMRKMVIMK